MKTYDHIFTAYMPTLFLGKDSQWGTQKDEWMDIEPFLLLGHKNLKIVFNLNHIAAAYAMNEDMTHRTICQVLEFVISSKKPEACVFVLQGEFPAGQPLWSKLMTTLIHHDLPTHLKLDFSECRIINHRLGFNVFETLRQIFINGHLSELTTLEINLDGNYTIYSDVTDNDLLSSNLPTLNRFLDVIHHAPPGFILHLSDHCFQPSYGNDLLLIHLAQLLVEEQVPAYFVLDLLCSQFSQPGYEAIFNAYRSPRLPVGCEISLGCSMYEISTAFIHSQYKAFQTWQPDPAHRGRLFYDIPTWRTHIVPCTRLQNPKDDFLCSSLPALEHAECKEQLTAIGNKINTF